MIIIIFITKQIINNNTHVLNFIKEKKKERKLYHYKNLKSRLKKKDRNMS